MYCKKCGEYLKEGALFCHKCGTRLNEETSDSKGNKKNDQPEIVKNYEQLTKSYYTKDMKLSTAIVKFMLGLILMCLVFVLGFIIPNAFTSMCIAIGFLLLSSSVVISPRSLYRMDKFLILTFIMCGVFIICLLFI